MQIAVRYFLVILKCFKNISLQYGENKIQYLNFNKLVLKTFNLLRFKNNDFQSVYFICKQIYERKLIKTVYF